MRPFVQLLTPFDSTSYFKSTVDPSNRPFPSPPREPCNVRNSGYYRRRHIGHFPIVMIRSPIVTTRIWTRAMNSIPYEALLYRVTLKVTNMTWYPDSFIR